MATHLDVFLFLQDAMERGERTALIVLTAIDGSAARGVGTLMGVSEAGHWCGSLSGGCTEAAIAGEARRVIEIGRAEELRIGAGSSLIDIRLPCGSAIDLLILPEPDYDAIEQAIGKIAWRRPLRLEARRDGSLATSNAVPGDNIGWKGDKFQLPIVPRIRFVIAGHGEEVECLARQAEDWGAEIEILTPDERLAGQPWGVLLKSQNAPIELNLDPWSALVLLFHDHDWEVPLLTRALGQQALWIGAMGSRATHERRLAALEAAGISRQRAAIIKGPIGLIPAARDPETLALSVLAEVVAAYKAQGFP